MSVCMKLINILTQIFLTLSLTLTRPIYHLRKSVVIYETSMYMVIKLVTLGGQTVTN
jgi:hypothetical protein